MEELITIEKLIEEAVKKGVNFGKGDPYNRLRYYTKIGLLPHMKRKVVAGEVIGHYPSIALDILLEIEKLKSMGLSNTEIAARIKTLTSVTNPSVVKVARILTPSTKAIRFIIFMIFGALVLAGFGFLPIGKTKNDLIQSTLDLDKKYILDSGTSYVPKDQTRVYVKSQNVKFNSKINITFSPNFTPASRYWVSQKIPSEGFFVELDAPIASDAEFNWWVTN